MRPPRALRYRLAWDHALCRAVLTIYTRALLGFERRRGRQRGVADGRSGTVTAIQRFGGGVQLNVQSHTLVLNCGFTVDGVDLSDRTRVRGSESEGHVEVDEQRSLAA